MKIALEKKTVGYMTLLYCRKKHKTRGDLCAPCLELLSYAELRLSKCPYKDAKPFCSACAIHCYKPDMRQRMKDVMRFAGPRLILRHPVLAFRHLFSALAAKKKTKKTCKVEKGI